MSDDAIIETANYKLIKQLGNYIFCNKNTKSCRKISTDIANAMIELKENIK